MPGRSDTGRIQVGTSGFQYPEWKGSFYPQALSTAKMLPFYAERFSTTEINFSFYRIPSLKTIAGWAGAVPEVFQFSFKAPQEITHVRRLQDCGGTLGRFFEAIGSLNKKLGAVLFQLPPFFKKDLPRLEDFLGGLPRGAKCALEFRHPSWFDDATFAALKTANAALCVAESEKLATPVAFTADFGYFRLRREAYMGRDLDRWAGVISRAQPQLRETYVYFKHEEAGVGPKFAKQFIAALV